MTSESLPFPSVPYRGIEHYRFVDHPIFFVRRAETLELLRSVMIFKGVVLFGSSGVGKSSLIDAGLLPDLIEMGLSPDRIRVQDRPGAEIVIERISLNDDGQVPYLAPSLAEGVTKDQPSRIVLSVAEFEKRLRAYAENHNVILVLDQFEEIITLFEETPREAGTLQSTLSRQESLIDAFVRILHDDTLRVKILFSFREDYLAKLTKLFLRAPELPNQYMRLNPPQKKALRDIIVRPLDEKLRVHYKLKKTFSDKLVNQLVAKFEQASEGDAINLSEVQIVCRELWESPDPDKLFAEKGVRGILEDYLAKELDLFSDKEREIAIGLLSYMLTVYNTRNFVSGVELIRMFQSEEQVSEETLKEVLKALTGTRLVRRELRYRDYFYEIASESLVPKIIEKKAERQKRLERRRLEEATRVEREEERRRAQQKLRQTRILLALVVLVTLLSLALASVMTKKQREEQILKLEAQDAKSLADQKTAEKEQVISILRRLFRAAPAPKSLGSRELNDLKLRLATDKTGGLSLISSRLNAGQFPPDQVQALVGSALTNDPDPQVAKAAQDLLAAATTAQAQQKAEKAKVDEDKLKALQEMRALVTTGSFPPELVLSLLGPTFVDKDSNPAIAKAAQDLLAEASAKNRELEVSITTAVINDPAIANRVPARVYIQIESEQQSPKANSIKAELEKSGFIVPDFEVVTFRAPRRYELRYYRRDDETKANELVALLKNLQLDAIPVYLPGYENSTRLRPGHYELWLASTSTRGQERYLVINYAPASEERRLNLLSLITPLTEREGGRVEILSANELLIGPYSLEQAQSIRQQLIDLDSTLSRKGKIVIIKR